MSTESESDVSFENMSSSSSSLSSNSDILAASFHENDFNQYEPYAHEPLADSSESEEDNEVDLDGIPLSIIQDRFEGNLASSRWCTCGHCDNDMLHGPREYRCCNEIDSAKEFKSEETLTAPVNCVTEHPDFQAVILHPRVLRVAANGLKTRRGKRYSPLGNENEFYRAVAYRLFISMVFGYMGYSNTRPLAACVYTKIRKTFPNKENNYSGYMSVEEREVL